MTPEGARAAVAYYAAARIIAQFDAGVTAPAPKPRPKTTADAIAAVVARARKAA